MVVYCLTLSAWQKSLRTQLNVQHCLVLYLWSSTSIWNHLAFPFTVFWNHLVFPFTVFWNHLAFLFTVFWNHLAFPLTVFWNQFAFPFAVSKILACRKTDSPVFVSWVTLSIVYCFRHFKAENTSNSELFEFSKYLEEFRSYSQKSTVTQWRACNTMIII